jgi:hypothetical protein
MCASNVALRKDTLTFSPSSFAMIWVEGQREIGKGVRLEMTRAEYKTRAA